MKQGLTWPSLLGLYLLALLPRTWDLGRLKHLVFDERYYAVQAYSLLTTGHEQELAHPYSSTPPPNPSLQAWHEGLRDIFQGPYFATHPPLGKWLLSLGQLLGSDPLFWRLPAALLGAASAVLLTLLLLELLGNRHLALAGGLLLAWAEPYSLTFSRLAMLDIFLQTFILAAALTYLKALKSPRGRRKSELTWATILLLGLATGIKWSAAYYLVAYFIAELWRLQQDRRRGDKREAATLFTLGELFLQGLASLAAYSLTWLGWFLSGGGWFRHWSETYPQDPFLPGWPHLLRSWLAYHRELLDYHAVYVHKSFESVPAWQWTYNLTPLTIDSSQPLPLQALASPLLWYGLLLTLPLQALLWRKATPPLKTAYLYPLALYLVAYLPWILIPRTSFPFYQVQWSPLVIALLLATHALLLEAWGESKRWLVQALGGLYLLAALGWAVWQHPHILGFSLW